MSQDWRFKHSPHVAIGGLRSYAGTQLRLLLHDDSEVALSSLCVASDTPQAPLTDHQQQKLVNTANLVTTEILSRTRQRRLAHRELMTTLLLRLRAPAASHGDTVEMTLQVLREIYAHEFVALAPIDHNVLHLQRGHHMVPLSTVQSGLWGNTDLIMANIVCSTTATAPNTTTFRAIVGPLDRQSKALVVASSNLRSIFDDSDAWFVDQCAQTLHLALVNVSLKQAYAARDAFFQNISHQLRTPLHGIPTSAELLEEEVTLDHNDSIELASKTVMVDRSVAVDCLSTMKRSGTELMTAINSMLRFNAFAAGQIGTVPTKYDLRDLERDVLEDALQGFSPRRTQGLAFSFERGSKCHATSVLIDADILKELPECLVVSASKATRTGLITVRTTCNAPGKTLDIDVIDEGIGLVTADRERIPLPYEEVDHQSYEPGLGLTLARQLATILGGSISSNASTTGRGSDFRIHLLGVNYTDLSHPPSHTSDPLSKIPSRYHIAKKPHRAQHLVHRLQSNLNGRGLQQSEESAGTLVIVEQPSHQDHFIHHTVQAQELQIIVVLSVAPYDPVTRATWTERLEAHLVLWITGPLFESRLDEILDNADAALHTRAKALTKQEMSGSDHDLATTVTNPALISDATQDLSTFIQRSLSTLHVLLVDDNVVNLAVLELYCKRRKLPCARCLNGLEAFNAFTTVILQGHTSSTLVTEMHHELILMDLQMPECNGIEAVRRIRVFEKQQQGEQERRRAQVRYPCVIVMVKGQDSVADRNECFEAGADVYLVKPVSMKNLDRVIGKYFH